MALENAGDEKIRQILGRAEEASKNLGCVMEDLLKLTKVESSPIRSNEESFNLSQTGIEFRKDFSNSLIFHSFSSHEGSAEGSTTKILGSNCVNPRRPSIYG